METMPSQQKRIGFAYYSPALPDSLPNRPCVTIG